MRWGLFLLLALSLGLNAGLLYVKMNVTRLPPPGAREMNGPPGGRLPAREELFRDHLDRMTKHLQLSETQRGQLQSVHEELLPQIVAKRRELEEIHDGIALRFGSPEMDPERFRELARRMNETQSLLDSLVIEAMLSESALLTPDQRQRYAREMPWGKRRQPPPQPR